MITDSLIKKKFIHLSLQRGMEHNSTPYLRFIDMMYRGRKDRASKYKRSKIAVYNRIIWGILYRRTFPAIRFGFTDEVREGIKKNLEKTFNK